MRALAPFDFQAFIRNPMRVRRWDDQRLTPEWAIAVQDCVIVRFKGFAVETYEAGEFHLLRLAAK